MIRTSPTKRTQRALMLYEVAGICAMIGAIGYYAMIAADDMQKREAAEAELLRELHEKVQTLDMEQRAIGDSVKSLSADIYR